MATRLLGGVEIEVGEDGFIQEPGKWSKAVAEDLGKEEASVSPMTVHHWKIIDCIRNYYLYFDVAPAVRMLCKNSGTNLRDIYEMFPRGPSAACKVAGLPKPTGCL